MASYTIEDIELIRKKSGISYQEAVALLDYHNGNVARALVDLERNGRIKPEGAAKAEEKPDHKGKKEVTSFFSRLYRFRMKVKKGDIMIANVSMLFALAALLISPHTVLLAAVLVLILGYSVSFDRQDKDFATANFEKMVKNAAENVKSTVNDFTSGLNDNDRKANEKPEEPAKPAKEDRSFYQANPAATTYSTPYTGTAPTLQVPVQVESQDGSVTVEKDDDGYTSATIE